ncbi:MAG: hypothetical protein DMF56_27200 [Acidobacteria bacterium]|nr:MAG: hypothetical protein DMF56_27200 [Acidobacteriota bacterium]
MPFQNITLAALQARLAQRYEQATFWAPASAQFALNESLRLWNLITGMARHTVNVLTVVDDPYIVLNIPATQQWLKVTRVSVPAPFRELNPTSLAGLDASFPGWEKQTTLTASGVGTAPRYWAPAGVTRLAVFPADTAVINGGNGPRTLAVDGISCASVLVAPDDFLDLGDEELTAILGYALHVLSFSKGADALAGTRPLYLAFLKAAADRNAVFAASSFYRKIIGLDWTRLAYPLRAASSVAAADQLIGEGGNGSNGQRGGRGGQGGQGGPAGQPGVSPGT